MRIKYKMKNLETGEVFVNVRGYLLHENGGVETIILTDNTQIPSKDVTFFKFLEEVDGKDIYEWDRVVVELTESEYDIEEGEFIYGDVKTITGTFRELYEEGLYFIQDDETGESIDYNMMKPKILSIR